MVTSATEAPSVYGIPAPGQRLPAATRLGHVALQVSDLERSLDYYQRVLGLQPLRRDADSAALGPADGPADGAEPLIELHQRRGARPVPPGGRLGLYHFAILLPDRAALGRLLAHLAHLGIHPGMADHRVSEALYLDDPDGLGIEVYADRPRSTWQVRGGQLLMTTDPLDVAGLLAAGDWQRWDGPPPGTRLGHVHLHVGDLPAAAAFYHRGLGLDQMVWSYPGALFLSAGGYHHHLGVNTWAKGAALAGENDARLLEWEVRVPATAEALAAIDSLAGVGAAVERSVDGGSAADPWGTRVRVRGEA